MNAPGLFFGTFIIRIPDASEDLDIEECEKEYWDETGEEESEPVDIEPAVRKTLVNCNVAQDVTLCLKHY